MDLVEADVEFVADEHRLGGLDALANFGVWRDQRDLAGRVDLHEGVRFEGRRIGRRVGAGEAWKPHAEKKAAAGKRARFENETA